MISQQILPENGFLGDVLALRRGVQADLAAPLDAQRSIRLLQSVLSAEIVCVLRYTMIAVSHEGLKTDWIGEEFQAQANDERKHMRLAAARIEALGGVPDYNPAGLAVLSPVAGDFAKRVAENLAAEQEVVAHYRALIGHFAGRDAESCAMLEEIIADEEDHASDMQDLLASYVG